MMEEERGVVGAGEQIKYFRPDLQVAPVCGRGGQVPTPDMRDWNSAITGAARRNAIEVALE